MNDDGKMFEDPEGKGIVWLIVWSIIIVIVIAGILVLRVYYEKNTTEKNKRLENATEYSLCR